VNNLPMATFNSAAADKLTGNLQSQVQLPNHYAGWWCGSVVRTSVFGWQTFPDLCLIYG